MHFLMTLAFWLRLLEKNKEQIFTNFLSVVPCQGEMILEKIQIILVIQKYSQIFRTLPPPSGGLRSIVVNVM